MAREARRDKINAEIAEERSDTRRVTRVTALRAAGIEERPWSQARWERPDAFAITASPRSLSRAVGPASPVAATTVLWVTWVFLCATLLLSVLCVWLF